MAQGIGLRAPNAGGRVQSLVRELDPPCVPQRRVHVPQLRSAAATKTPCNHIDEKKKTGVALLAGVGTISIKVVNCETLPVPGGGSDTLACREEAFYPHSRPLTQP